MATKSAINPLAVKIGERMRAFRRARGMKQETLAAEVGYSSRAAIAQFENGFALPSLEKAIELARALGIDPGALFKEDSKQAEAMDLSLTYREVMQASAECRMQFIRFLRSMIADLEQTLETESDTRRSLKAVSQPGHTPDRNVAHCLYQSRLLQSSIIYQDYKS